MTMLRYRNLRTLFAVSANAENTENSLQPRRLGYNAAGLFALACVGMTSTAASAGEYCRWDVTSHVKSCSFDTLEQCQATSSGRGGDRSRSLLGEPQHRLRLSTKAPALENEKAGRELAARAARVQDGLDGDEAADILVLVRNHFADRLGNRDLRRRRGLRLRLALSAGRQRGHEQNCQQAGHSQCLHKRRHETHHLGAPVAW